MARNLRRFGEVLVKYVAPIVMAGSIILGLASHIASRHHSAAIEEIYSKSSAEVTEADRGELEDQQLYLETNITQLEIAAYGTLASSLIAAAGGALCLDYRRRKENKQA